MLFTYARLVKDTPEDAVNQGMIPNARMARLELSLSFGAILSCKLLSINMLLFCSCSGICVIRYNQPPNS